MNNNHLSTTTTIIESRGWSLHTSLSLVRSHLAIATASLSFDSNIREHSPNESEVDLDEDDGAFLFSSPDFDVTPESKKLLFLYSDGITLVFELHRAVHYIFSPLISVTKYFFSQTLTVFVFKSTLFSTFLDLLHTLSTLSQGIWIAIPCFRHTLSYL